MTVKELIDELKQYPPHHDVKIVCFDNNIEYLNIVDLMNTSEAKDAKVGCMFITQHVNS